MTRTRDTKPTLLERQKKEDVLTAAGLTRAEARALVASNKTRREHAEAIKAHIRNTGQRR